MNWYRENIYFWLFLQGFQSFTDYSVLVAVVWLILTWTHLNLLHDLLPEGAHLGGAGDGHVLGALVLAGDAVERRGVLLHVVAQVRL